MLLLIAQGLSVQVKSSGSSPTLQSRIVTPSSSTQYITPQSGYDGLSQVTVHGDSNLINSNIKNGVSIFGVIGNYGKNDLKIKRTTVTTSLGSFLTSIPSTTTTIYGMFLSMAEENTSSSSSPITSLWYPQSFDLIGGQQCLFSNACYLTFKKSPYWVVTTGGYAMYPNIQNNYWYFNMNDYNGNGFYGKTYWLVYFYI